MKTNRQLLFASGLLGLCLIFPVFRLSATVQSSGQVQIGELRAFVYADGGYVQSLTAFSAGYSSNFNATGYGSFGWDFNSPAATTLQHARLVVFLDADLDRATTTFFNEYAALVNLNTPPGAMAGDIAASGWEIDEPGFLFGSLVQHLTTGVLSQTNSVPANARDDVAFALSFSLGTLQPNASVKVRCFISQTNIGGLRQTDADTSTTLYFNGYVQNNQPANQPPMIIANTITAQQGSPAAGALIATVKDDLTPAGALSITVTAPVPGISLSNITNNSGTIMASVAAACNAALGNNQIGLAVTDGGGLTDTANLIINVTANTPPVLGNYPSAGVINLAASATVTPSAAPTDNGSVVSLTASTPKFTGAFGVNPTTGVVTINNAAPSGSYSVAVTATDNCGATSVKTFGLVINGAPTITPQTVTRQQGSPGSASTIAVVSDDLTPASNLTVTATTIPAGLTLTNLTNTNGTVSANITAACNATLGANTIVLRATDGGGLSTTGNLTVNVTASAPTLGTYPATGVGLGSSLTVPPSSAPADSSAVTVTIAPSSFAGTVSINQSSGVVSINNAKPAGSYTVTVTATGSCSTISTRSFVLTVNPVETCGGANCSAVGPGVEFASGSVLVYNLYASSAANPNSENTRINLTNTNPSRSARVHLFFVDGSNCSVADNYVCLTPNQTASFLVSDFDPGTTGYVVAVVVDRNGCPTQFNYLIGDAYIKLATRQAANLVAEAIPALAGAPAQCDEAAALATLKFDGISYAPLPRTLALDNLASPNDHNATLLVVNRIGGSLATGANTLDALTGLLYDDMEHAFSFSLSGGCQLRGVLSINFPRTAPRLSQIIPAGRSGWLKLSGANDIGIFGAALNFNPDASTNASVFNQGHNLHKLTLTTAASLEIPIFPPNC